MVLVPVILLRGQLAQRLVRDVLGGPDLAVGMGIAGAHHGAAVLEDLHMVDIRQFAQRGRLAGPRIHHGGDFRHVHARQRQRVVGMEAEHAATPAFRLGDQQRRGVGLPSG